MSVSSNVSPKRDLFLFLTSPNASFISRMAFYSSYHNTFGNKLIHLICVPIILYSGALLASCIPLNFGASFPKDVFVPFASVPLAMILMSIYSIAYILLGNVFATLPFIGFMWVQYYFAQLTLFKYGVQTSLLIAALTQVLGWVPQVFIGHHIIEKRAPALLDDRIGALIAPLFVWYEIIWMFGFQKDVYQQVQKRSLERIEWMNNHSTKRGI